MEAGRHGLSGLTVMCGVAEDGRSDHGPVPTLLRSTGVLFVRECQCRKLPALRCALVRYPSLTLNVTPRAFSLSEVLGGYLCYAEPLGSMGNWEGICLDQSSYLSFCTMVEVISICGQIW